MRKTRSRATRNGAFPHIPASSPAGHRGQNFAVVGPLNVERSPQDQPVIQQGRYRGAFHDRPNLTFSDGTPLNAMATKDAITRARTQQNSALIKDLEPVSNVTTTGGYDVNAYLNHPESTNTG